MSSCPPKYNLSLANRRELKTYLYSSALCLRNPFILFTFFQFNDVLLCCAQTTTGKLNVRQVMDVAGITIDTDVVTIPENGFRVKSKQRVLDLITNAETEKNEWISAILNAVDELEAKRGTFKVLVPIPAGHFRPLISLRKEIFAQEIFAEFNFAKHKSQNWLKLVISAKLFF